MRHRRILSLFLFGVCFLFSGWSPPEKIMINRNLQVGQNPTLRFARQQEFWAMLGTIRCPKNLCFTVNLYGAKIR